MTGTNRFGNKTCQGLDDFLRPEHLISPETKLFCKTLRKFVDKEVLPHEEEMDEFWDWTEREGHNFVHDIWKRLLIDVGLQKSFMPPEFGGTGGGTTVESCATVEKVARGDFSVACTGFISPWSIAAITIPKPNEFLLKKFSPLLCGDEVNMICSAITEPHAGDRLKTIVSDGKHHHRPPDLRCIPARCD